MGFEEERDEFPLYGVNVNEDSDYDDEYLAKMTGRSKAPAMHHASKLERLPLKEIQEALTCSEPLEEPGSEQYIRERLADRATCVYCFFETHNRQLLAEHLQQHREIREFRQSYYDAGRQCSSMKEKRQRIKEQIESMQEQVRELDDRISRFDVNGLKAMEKQYRVLSRLLEGSDRLQIRSGKVIGRIEGLVRDVK